MNLFKTMAGLLIDERQSRQSAVTGTINDVNAQYEAMNHMELGTFTSRDKLPRTRQQIFTMWEIMQKDPQIAEALSLHVTAALGGHETTGDMIFITPHERVRAPPICAARAPAA